ncbi:hypothetical protein WJX77_008937 [Trebouxia sp. C0004]
MRKKQGQHFADIFEVLEKDPDGKRFDKVSRIRAHSDMYEMDLLLDINSDLYPVDVADKFSLALSTTLHRNNEDFPDYYDKDLATQHGKGTLLDDYDYVMHGKVFKFKDNHNTGQLKVETQTFGIKAKILGQLAARAASGTALRTTILDLRHRQLYAVNTFS